MSENENFVNENEMSAQKEKNVADKKKSVKSSLGKKRFSALFSSNWFIAAVLACAVLIISVIIIGITMSTQGQTLGEVLFGIKVKRIDYLNDSLDKYLDPQPEDYKNIELELNVPKPTQKDVDEFILNKLAAGAKDAGKVSINYQFNTPISAGDRIYFYYAAYLKDENGNRIKELDGLNNCVDYGKNSDQPQVFVVGSRDFGFLDGINYELESAINNVYSGRYIRGFENGLIGVVPTKFKFYTVGDVEPDDIVYATATYVDDAGRLYDEVDVRIDLGDANCEKIWGEGIYTYVIEGHQIGDRSRNLPTTLTCAESGKRITYTSFVVNYVSDGAEPTAVLETTFPYDHPDKSLQNATVYFDIFIEKTEDYNTPALDDAFVIDYLKLSEEKLSAYEGTSVAEKCRAYYLEQLNKEYEVNRNLLAEERLWEKLKENIEIKKLPEREIIYEYQDYVFFKELELEAENNAGAGYEDIDDFMEADLGLSVGGDWENIVYSMLEDEVIEKLIFYSILKKENKLADGVEFESFCRAELEAEYERETGKTAADFESAEKYDAEIAALRVRFVLQSGGEAQYIEEMYYRYGSKLLLGYAILKDVV